MECVASQLVHEVVRGHVASALRESAAEQLAVERTALQIHRVLPEVAEAIISEEVRWSVPDIVKVLVVDMAQDIVLEHRCEVAWRSLSDDCLADMTREAAWIAIAEVAAAETGDTMVDEIVAELIADCYPELLGVQDRLRRSQVLDAIRSTATEHIVNVASFRYLTQLLGTKAMSLLIHRALFLKTSKDIINRLDNQLRAATEPRRRLDAEPLLAYAFDYLCRPALVEALDFDLDAALDAYDAAVQLLEDASHGRAAGLSPR